VSIVDCCLEEWTVHNAQPSSPLDVYARDDAVDRSRSLTITQFDQPYVCSFQQPSRVIEQQGGGLNTVLAFL